MSVADGAGKTKSVEAPVPLADRLTFTVASRGGKNKLRSPSDCENDKDTVPEKLSRLVRVIVVSAEDLRGMERLVGSPEMEKLGASGLVKIAVWIVSGTSEVPPFAMLTHVLVPFSLPLQPDMYPRGIEPVPVTL